MVDLSQPLDSEASAVARATAALLNAVNGSDIAGVLVVWSDEGILMPPHHPAVHGRVEIERYFERIFRKSRFRFSFTSSHIEVCGGIAFERVDYTVSVYPESGPQTRDAGKGLHVYRRQPDGSWKLALDIWNSDISAGAGQ
jgi:ketosteroid isomerase-like protein